MNLSRPGLWQACAVALAGHLAVLGWLYSDVQDQGVHGVAQPARFSVSFRLLVDPAERASAAAPEARSVEPPSGSAADVADRTQTAAAASSPAPAVPAPAMAPASAVLPMPVAPEEPVYLTRGELTVAPRPLGTVDVPFPEDVVGLVDLKVQVTLFIDEEGEVRQVRIDTPQVAEPFERAIRASFGAARFSPGQVGDMPVRSQVRVEVAFAAPNAGTRRPRS